jgi:hypothetical protein
MCCNGTIDAINWILIKSIMSKTGNSFVLVKSINTQKLDQIVTWNHEIYFFNEERRSLGFRFAKLLTWVKCYSKTIVFLFHLQYSTFSDFWKIGSFSKFSNVSK